MKKPSDIFAILVGIVLLLIVVGIAIVITRSGKNTPDTSESLTPTPSKARPTAAALNGNPLTFYNESAQDKLLAAIKAKKPLSAEDGLAKANILAARPADKQSGVLYTSNQIIIEYVQAPDLFMVEILTTDINAAKSAANLWFRSRGLSQQALCSMPVSFYLNYEVANQLRGKNINFSPLANGC